VYPLSNNLAFEPREQCVRQGVISQRFDRDLAAMNGYYWNFCKILAL
jgi:hypothetical protein